MQSRLDHFQTLPEAFEPMIALEKYLATSGLEHSLIELVKMRASQINGCAFCLHMHATDARRSGESEERLYLLNAWRESPLYSDRGRAALGWCEALTRIAETQAPDEDYQRLEELFSPEEQVKLTLVITNINAWNRIAVGFRAQHPTD